MTDVDSAVIIAWLPHAWPRLARAHAFWRVTTRFTLLMIGRTGVDCQLCGYVHRLHKQGRCSAPGQSAAYQKLSPQDVQQLIVRVAIALFPEHCVRSTPSQATGAVITQQSARLSFYMTLLSEADYP